jgi:hypothetical protein
VTWQATTFVVVAVVVAVAIGVALGAAAGRLAWSAFADHLGAVAEPVTWPLAFLTILPAALVVSNIIAAVPAVIAGRMRPALALRTE